MVWIPRGSHTGGRYMKNSSEITLRGGQSVLMGMLERAWLQIQYLDGSLTQASHPPVWSGIWEKIVSLGAQEFCYGNTLKAVFLWSRRHCFVVVVFLARDESRSWASEGNHQRWDSPVEMEIRKELEIEIRRAR